LPAATTGAATASVDVEQLRKELLHVIDLLSH
jgi:hypothetical protein